ncbi:ABC1 kinase family protein [Pseudoxanthomonas winnipegensis]|jgi:predicted unusual protein kinase regulating ubiquinone biosynthesis (AarF/ABC1/UbiB family)|uniref:AarF/ABC1/UbiB kinase family protein n=1 Tax=Pseudoxanthomonas winnipegensis TaxID=2480810 RepID=A0A4V2HCP7_9GAMM|nr:AarF/UbiB family protein [Pseudoxanthomonas winnipegensis]TAA23210.1 AarF/ABC1/UbiB kinase family protein [Pseudoxanthomonas winnipegensis]
MTEASASAPGDPSAAPHSEGAMERRKQIMKFLFRYRRSGVFSGFSQDALLSTATVEDGTPDEFSRDLEALGPTFIKLGQMLSTRPDIVPPAYAVALERMQEDVSPVPAEQIRLALEAELGVRLSKIFKTFDPEPLGTASLAQVHRAVLRDGTVVAVKVQKPGVAQRLLSDLSMLRSIAGAADRLTKVGRNLRFSDWLEEFGRTLVAELDYVAEAENLERFATHLKDHPELMVPRPVWDLTRRRVLTMELVQGARVDQISPLRRTEHSMQPLSAALLRGYLDQIFIYGEIHADPHPGNLRVTPDNRLAIFDLGMVANVPPGQRETLLKLLFAAVDGRGEQVAREMLALGTQLEDFDGERFNREIGQLISRYSAHSATTSEGRVVLDLVRTAMACGLRTPPELSMLGKALLNLDTVCRALSPELDAKAVVEGHLQHVMRARLRQSFSSPNMASELMDLQTLAREGPRRVSDILGLLSENKMQMRISGLEESHLMESLQKIANRVAAGVVTAALILASALMMRIPTASTLFGYPTIALILFFIGALLGASIVISALLGDRKVKNR